MGFAKRYRHDAVEPELARIWEEEGTYHFRPEEGGELFTIDTPPPTVSGKLHMGHVYSYSHADFIARFWRMNGRNVLYPMGYDDNGLPTERLVEQRLGVRATEIGRRLFIEKCLQVSEEAEKEYEALWKRLGLSIDWRYTYRTIDEASRRISQLSFIDLYEQGLVYRRRAPTIWCPECQTAIAQAELNDLDRRSEYVTLKFYLDDGAVLPIATTRPELLPACVAIFVHPDDERYQDVVGRNARVPYFTQSVPIMADPDADPDKGTGAVMCCTFGDTTDVAWWYKHKLDLVEAVTRDGRMAESSKDLSGLTLEAARAAIKEALKNSEEILASEPTLQSIRVHERCDTPVEYVVASQWFIRVLDFKHQFIDTGAKVAWHPEHMESRFRQWVENLNWDWCISRQRYFGVTFPVWYCDNCGEIVLADRDQLPVDPAEDEPARACTCGSDQFSPESDVMDTWATSSMTPQLVGRWLENSGFDGQPFRSLNMRPQAHEIIRTWAFYSIVKSFHHFKDLPWMDAAISGWGLAPEGSGKISKSRGGGPAPPMEMLENYSADAVRYWAASAGLGKDSIISDEKIVAGSKLITKIWNVARFSSRFLGDTELHPQTNNLTPSDRWLLSRLQRLIGQVNESFIAYDYATAKSLLEIFFWNDLADNYLEMVKKRLYERSGRENTGARYTLSQALLVTLKLFAPFMPFVTEEIYRQLFAVNHEHASIHRSTWPKVDRSLIDSEAEEVGELLVDIATAVRRYKSTNNLSLGVEISQLTLAGCSENQRTSLNGSEVDIMSITRAQEVKICTERDVNGEEIGVIGQIRVVIRR